MQKISDIFSPLVLYVFVFYVVVLSGCKSGAPNKPLVGNTPSSVAASMVIEQISPFPQSPLASVSPVRTLSPPTPTVVNIVRSMVSHPDRLVKPNTDLSSVALHADDMQDLFDITYNITQPYQKYGMYGLDVIYPSRIIEHTSAFAEGYRTKIEVYEDFQDAVNAYDMVVSEQTDEMLNAKPVGDLSRFFSGISTDGMYIHVYKIVALKSNALIIITIKTKQELSSDTLRHKAELVLNRIDMK